MEKVPQVSLFSSSHHRPSHETKAATDMDTYVKGQWPQVFSREEWQQQSVDMLTSYQELEIFQPAHELTHQRPTKKRKRNRAKPGRQDENDILLLKSLHQRRGFPTATMTNARRMY
ncbi:hypothetical protein FPANT_432 [Fusarium pseudoanthophilum]|uniref:Uncharacterized protein n=1 Tax=Fusarium pseudoanthophilum TaxID=48495 RepID=A0A8H5V2M3_9HYPO|nr:hypothetical protein FPANT_432 [Fusarium pseudoanthophilum]